MSKGVKKIIAIIIVIIIVATAYYIWQKGKGYETGVATLDDLLKSKSERKIGSTTVIVSDENPYYALIGTPVALYYDDEIKQSSPLLIDGNYTEKFLSLYKPTSTFRIDGEIKETSLNVTKSFWKKAGGAILIEEGKYELCLSIAPLAAYLNIPIIIADNTNSVVGTLENLDVKYTLVCGGLEGYGNTKRFNSVEEIQDFVLDFISKKFGKLSYITMTNINDINSDYGISSVSCLAPYLSAAHNGVVLTISHPRLPSDAYVDFKVDDPNSPVINATNEKSALIKHDLLSFLDNCSKHKLLTNYLEESPFLAILGDSYSIPFYEEYNEKRKYVIPTDNYYADVQNDYYTGSNELVLELATGRPIAGSLSSTSALISRSILYDKYMPLWQADSPVAEVMGAEWKDSAYVCEGRDVPIIFYTAKVMPVDAQIVKFLREQGFTVHVTKQEESAEAFAQDVLKYYSSSNIIHVTAHGSTSEFNTAAFDGCTVEDIRTWNLGPSVMDFSSCTVAMTDLENPSDTVCLALMDAGVNAFIGSMRPEYCYGYISLITEEKGGVFICKYDIENLVEGNKPTGLALRDSKNKYATNNNAVGDGYIYYDWAIKQLYGDPAFNPYEP